MELVLFSAVHLGQLVACSFEISCDGQAFTPADESVPGSPSITFDGTTVGVLEVQIASAPADLWPPERNGKFHPQPGGGLALVDGSEEWEQPRSVVWQGQGATMITVYLSEFRDASARCLELLGDVPAAHTQDVPTPWPPQTWGTPDVAGIDYIDADPVSNGELSLTTAEVDPDTEDVVLERRADGAPKYIAVSWPKSVSRYAAAGPVPFLVYFHANVSQNYPTYYAGAYPESFDFVYYGLWNYLNYRENPITAWPYSLGLPYQVAAAAKPTVLVLPCSNVSSEVGDFTSAESAASLLQGIAGFFYRRDGLFDTNPGVGRTALAGFSASTGLVGSFLTNPDNQQHPFVTDSLREVYLFDPPAGGLNSAVTAATGWATANGTDRMVRLYCQTDTSALDVVVPPPRPSTPFVESNTGGTWTVGLIPGPAWNHAAQQRGAPTMGQTFDEVHHLFPSVMLTDAVRRSGF
jgi:hypothetical protein